MGTARNQPSLPTQRAFVVQLYAESKIEKGQFKGRVEHIVSGQSTHFLSTRALKAFMRYALTKEREKEPEASCHSKKVKTRRCLVMKNKDK